MRKSRAKVSTTAFILRTWRRRGAWLSGCLWLEGLCPTLQAEQPQVSRAQHLAEPGAKIPEPELRAGGARGTGGGSGMYLCECSEQQLARGLFMPPARAGLGG